MRGHLDADPADLGRIFGHGLQTGGQVGRELGARQGGEARHLGVVGHRHDPGQDGPVDAEGPEVVDEAEIVVEPEEELGDGEVGGGELGRQVPAVAGAVGRGRVPLGVGGDADRERSGIPGQFDEVDGVGQVPGRQLQFGRRISPKGQDVLHTLVPVPGEDRPQLALEVAGAAEVGHRRHVGRPEDVDDEIVGPLPGRPARAVRD